MKYLLMEKMQGSNSENWITELSLSQAEDLGEKSKYDIVKIFTDDKNVKLIKTIKESKPDYLRKYKINSGR